MSIRHLLAASTLAAASLVAADAGAQTCVVGALVYTGLDPDARTGTVCFEDGVITEVHEGAVEVAGAELIDGAGSTLTAGLIDVDTRVGMVEIWAVDETRDTSGTGDSIRAAFRAADNINPQSTLFAIARSGGITAVVSAPDGGLVSGQAAWLNLRGERAADMIVDPGAAMAMSLGAPAGDAEAEQGDGSRGMALLRYRELFDDVRLWADNPDAFDAAEMRELTASRLDLQAMLPVLEGEQRVLVRATSQQDLRAGLALAAEYDLDVTFVGADDAWAMAEELAAADVAVVVRPTDNLPERFASLGAREDGAALLVAAGVTVAINSGDTHNARVLRQVAGNAVRAGMSWHDAMRAITVVPAALFGMGDRYGVVAPGYAASLVLWSGDPLELSSAAERMFIDGEPVDLRSRQDVLYERYR